MNFRDEFAARRRLDTLRLLVRLNGTANEDVIVSSLRHEGDHVTPRDVFRADLDHLKTFGLLREQLVVDLRIVTLTERGEDVAFGRLDAPGVWHEIWHRPEPLSAASGEPA